MWTASVRVDSGETSIACISRGTHEVIYLSSKSLLPTALSFEAN